MRILSLYMLPHQYKHSQMQISPTDVSQVANDSKCPAGYHCQLWATSDNKQLRKWSTSLSGWCSNLSDFIYATLQCSPYREGSYFTVKVVKMTLVSRRKILFVVALLILPQRMNTSSWFCLNRSLTLLWCECYEVLELMECFTQPHRSLFPHNERPNVPKRLTRVHFERNVLYRLNESTHMRWLHVRKVAVDNSVKFQLRQNQLDVFIRCGNMRSSATKSFFSVWKTRILSKLRRENSYRFLEQFKLCEVT